MDIEIYFPYDKKRGPWWIPTGVYCSLLSRTKDSRKLRETRIAGLVIDLMMSGF